MLFLTKTKTSSPNYINILSKLFQNKKQITKNQNKRNLKTKTYSSSFSNQKRKKKLKRKGLVYACGYIGQEN